MEQNIIKVSFNKWNTVRICGLDQWDKGQVLLFTDKFPDGTEVQFFDGSVKLIVGNCIRIPDKFLEKAGEFKAWIQVIGENHETTTKEMIFNVKYRQKKEEYIPPEEEDTFREELQKIVNQAGVLLNESKETISRAEQLIDKNGYMNFDIDEKGHLIETRTDNVSDDFTFELDEKGHLVINT